MNTLSLSDLTVHLRGTGPLRLTLYEQLFGAAAGDLIVVPVDAQGKRVEKDLTRVRDWRRPVGFGDHEALLPFDARSFQGYRLLREYFALPERFLFANFAGLGEAVRKCTSDQIDLIVLLSSVSSQLEDRVEADNFALHCAPAVNLFPREADRIHLSDGKSEFRVTIDRMRPADFEVYQVQSVRGIGASNSEQQEFRPFYAATDIDGDGGRGRRAYYAVHRANRVPSEREARFGRRSPTYGGSDVFISLVDADAAPFRPDLRQLAVRALCTNRDLPLHLPIGGGTSDFTLDIGAPVTGVRCVGTPTSPRPSPASGSTAWRLISHLTLNYLSLTDSSRGGATALRDILKLYADLGGAQSDMEIEGLRSVKTMPITRRVPTPGPLTFARGLEVRLRLEEANYGGAAAGAFLFASVLERFLAKYVSINSFTETVLETAERGEVMRWPATMGLRATL